MVTLILIALVVIIIALAIVLYYNWRWARMTTLRRNGIPGPKPHWVWGNLINYLQTPNVTWDTQLSEEFGPIAGYYLGAKPMILVTDLDLLEVIQCRKGCEYLDRPRRVPGGINPDPKRAEMLGNLKVPKWKTVRTVLNKGFPPEKLQHMSWDIKKLINIFMNKLPPSAIPKSNPVNFYSLYQNLTLDLIGKAGFGVHSDIQNNPNDALKHAVEQEFSKSTSTAILKFYLCFPEFHWFLQPIRVKLEWLKQRIGLGGQSELWDQGLEIVSRRKAQIASTQLSQTPSDLLHLMLTSGKLTEMSIVANSVLIFEAGFETLSASLAFITHLLMTHLDIQTNVRNEIQDILLETGGEIKNISKLKDFNFLDAVIKEGLRMFPPQTTFIGRSGMHDLEHSYRTEDGIKRTCIIPKNVHIQVGLYQILNSSKIWEEPRKFRPERFLNGLNKEQKIAFQPFGKGRRICIGRTYADVVLKLVFIELFKKYKVLPVSEDSQTEIEIEVLYKTATMTPKNGVYGCLVQDPLFPA